MYSIRKHSLTPVFVIDMNGVMVQAMLIAVLLTTLTSTLFFRFYIIRIRRKADLVLIEKRSEIERVTQLSGQLSEENKWLTHEIHHRVKNNLQIIMSLLNSQSAFLKDHAAIAAIRTSQQRVSAMSLIHKRLYTEDDMAGICLRDYVMELVDFLKDSFQLSGGIKFVTELNPIKVDVTTAIPLGLILNEAIANAISHAFPSGTGVISVHIYFAEQQIRVIVKDDGIGMPASFRMDNTESFGMKLIRGLAGELNGKLTIARSDVVGTELCLVFPYKESALS